MKRVQLAILMVAMLILPGCAMPTGEVPPIRDDAEDDIMTVTIEDGQQYEATAGEEWIISGSVTGSTPTKVVVSISIDGVVLARSVPDATGRWILDAIAPEVPGDHQFEIKAQPPRGDTVIFDATLTVLPIAENPPLIVIDSTFSVQSGGLLWISGSVDHAARSTCSGVYSPTIGSERPLSVDSSDGKFSFTLISPSESHSATISVSCGTYMTKMSIQEISIKVLSEDAVDSDGDGILDPVDLCPESAFEFTSSPDNDHDGDGCQDSVEDSDDDADGVADADDGCPTGVIGWDSNDTSIDLDGDGCRDADEDGDDDGDGIEDSNDGCPNGASFTSSAVSDHDSDGCRDMDEDVDDDGDGVADVDDDCPIGSIGRGPSESSNDFDGDGCRDADEDADDDGDGVEDANDQCPTTNAEDQANEYGCSDAEWDEDGDGIFDRWDSCLGSPPDSPVNSVGCADLDRDGVFANVDECPDSEPRWTANATGCTLLQTPIAWSAGPYGTDPFDYAGQWTIQTQRGTLRFDEHWDGNHTYIFIFNQKSNSYSNGIWNQNLGPLMETMPSDVHVFFGSYDSDWSSDMSAIQNRIDSWMNQQNQTTRDSWNDRYHLIQERGWDVDGSLKDVITDWSKFHYGIDRFQRWRQIGSLHDWSQGTSCCTRSEYLANDPAMWAAEFAPEVRGQDPAITTVDVWSGENHPGGWSGGHHSKRSATLPNTTEMAAFDTMEVYFHHACPDRRDRYGIDDDGDGFADRHGGCHEWDYLAYLNICDSDNESVCGTEFVRYITTYGREGKWLTDVSEMLWMVREGGNRSFRYSGANGGDLDVRIHLSTWGDSGIRPAHGELAFTGGRFNDQYNNGTLHDRSHELNISQRWDRVEIVAVITGHGFGEVTENCAEFCNHEHRWSMNGNDVTEDHPWAGNSSLNSDREGCKDDVSKGVTANQFGSWPYARAGWCPGLDVKPWVFDITAWIDWNGTNNMSYQGLYDGQPYTQTSTNPNIVAKIWIVYHANVSNQTGGFEIDSSSRNTSRPIDDVGPPNYDPSAESYRKSIEAERRLLVGDEHDAREEGQESD